MRLTKTAARHRTQLGPSLAGPGPRLLARENLPGRTGRVAVVGVPMDLGASKKGCAGGPAAIRRTELARDLEKLDLDVEDYGDVPVPSREEAKTGSGSRRYADSIAKVCRALAEQVRRALKDGRRPITLGGDHSLAMGSVGGVAAHYREKGQKIGLIWVDAHGDMNTPATSPSGNVHGMPLAHLLGYGDRALAAIGGNFTKLEPATTCLLGVRDIDQEEREAIRRSGIHVITMKEIDLRGMPKAVAQALDWTCEGTAGVHVSVDIDVVDPTIAQGVGTPSRGGLTYREAHLLMELIADSRRLTSLDMVEVNPLEDVHNNTGELAAELIQSALGKRIF